MSKQLDRTEVRPRAVVTIDGVVVTGAEEGVDEVALPRSFTVQEVKDIDMTPDEAHAAVACRLLTVPQMQRLLGGPSLTNKELFRRLLAAAEAEATTRAKMAAETQAAEAA